MLVDPRIFAVGFQPSPNGKFAGEENLPQLFGLHLRLRDHQLHRRRSRRIHFIRCTVLGNGHVVYVELLEINWPVEIVFIIVSDSEQPINSEYV
nr:hypothetical polypeptide I [Hyposoter didymator ichnovirus]